MTRHKVAPNLLMLFMLVGGLLVMLRIKQEVFPEFDQGMVTVRVPYPGASPEEVEQGILLSIEEGIRGIVGVKEVTSEAREGAGVVSAELDEGIDDQRVYQEIRQEVDRITTLPEEAEEPEVVLVTRRREVLDLMLYGDTDEYTLRDLAEQVRDQLLQHPGITQVDLLPNRVFEVGIEISQERLRSHKLTLQTIAERIRAAAIEVPGGSLRTEGGEILVRMKERRDFAAEFGGIPVITLPDGTQLLVRDLGTVRDTFEESFDVLSYNGAPAINLEVYRIGDQTPLGVSEATLAMVEKIRPSLPEGIHLDVPRDHSEIYRQRLDLLLRNGFMGLVLVLGMLTVFLEYRLAFWVTMGIPISFMGAFLLLPSMDVTINMISMFAFIMALGIVVDDAIVVGENVFDMQQAGGNRLEAVIRGTREVAVPVTFSVLSNIAAFIPLAFVPGVMGKTWRVIPLVVSSVFFISLLESLFVLPAHLAHEKSGPESSVSAAIHRGQQSISRLLARMISGGFGPLLKAALRARYLTVALGTATLIACIGFVISGRLGFEMMPRVESDRADVTAVLPYGSPLSRMNAVRDRLVREAEKVMAENGGDKLVLGIRGFINENVVEVGAYLTDPDTRPISTARFTELWRVKVGEIEGLQSLRFQSDRGGPGSGASLTVELAHRDIPTLDAASAALADALAEFSNVTDIDDGYTPGKQQVDFKMLPEGRSLGLNASDVARQLRGSFYGAEALRQQRGRNEVKVMVRLPREQRISEYDIESFIVRTPGGEDVMLNQVATVERGRAYTEISRRDGRRTVSVTAEVKPESETDQVIAKLEASALPELVRQFPGLAYSFQGKQEEMRESMTALRNGFVMALMAIYVMLGIPFRSYFQPMIVMISIPFGIVGAVLGHMLMGYSLSLVSMMGVIALSGVVVNDALVLVEYANRQMADGNSASQAVLNAGVRRFRPILLTTITTFGGLAPMIFETSRQARFMIPMALSLGYGILFATVITLILVPCLYLVLDDARRMMTRLFGGHAAVEPRPQVDPTFAGPR